MRGVHTPMHEPCDSVGVGTSAVSSAHLVFSLVFFCKRIVYIGVTAEHESTNPAAINLEIDMYKFNDSNIGEFQNTAHRTPAEMCAHIAHVFFTADGRNDASDVSNILRHYKLDALIDECIDEWSLNDEWMQFHTLTRADITHAFHHFADERPDMVFTDEELREAERDYQDELKADDRREQRAFGLR